MMPFWSRRAPRFRTFPGWAFLDDFSKRPVRGTKTLGADAGLGAASLCQQVALQGARPQSAGCGSKMSAFAMKEGTGHE